MSSVVESVTNPVFFSQHVGIIFSSSDAIASNSFMLEHIYEIPDKSIDKSGGQISFNIDSSQLGYFMHMLFAHMPEGFILQTLFDGIHTFEGQDENGMPARFNAQLVTLSQVATPMPD